MKICFLTKKEKPFVKKAIEYSSKISSNIDVFDSNEGTKVPDIIYRRKYDIIFSYICGWIIPKKLLNSTKKWNINFHPGPPNYPGTGCFNFAIYDNARKYGATAHIMNSAVDTGKIIAVKEFAVNDNETVDSLSRITYEALFNVFKGVVD